MTTYYREIYLYVPRHSRATFVEQIDFVSGLGHNPARRLGARPCFLINNLGQFDFAHGKMRLISHHSGVTVDRIRAKTGFPLEIAPDLHETETPTNEQVRLLRKEIDPLGIRRLETLSGAARKHTLRKILKSEKLLASQGFAQSRIPN